MMIVAKEGAIDALIESSTEDEFIDALKERGNAYEIVDAKRKIAPMELHELFRQRIGK